MNDPGLDRIPCYCDARSFQGEMEMKIGLLPTVKHRLAEPVFLDYVCKHV